MGRFLSEVSVENAVGHLVVAGVIAFLWYLVFPVEVTYPSDVLVEGTYLLLVIGIAVYLRQFDNRALRVGWTLFAYARYLDWLDELFVEANPLVNPYLQGVATIGSLTVTFYGVYRAVASREARVDELAATNEELATANDELAATNEALNAANEDLEAANRRLDRFASILSHDLRTPLNVAHGRVELARETGDTEHLADAERALDRIDSMIDGVLALVDDETVEETEPVPLSAVATDAWASLDTGDATLTTPDASVTVPADRSRLRQLLGNLFRNALEHAGEAPAVVVGTREDGTGFYVADDGPGIPPDERDAAFEWGESGSDGTGFGLAIVERLAAAHDWDVTLEASESGGTRVTVATDPDGEVTDGSETTTVTTDESETTTATTDGSETTAAADSGGTGSEALDDD